MRTAKPSQVIIKLVEGDSYLFAGMGLEIDRTFHDGTETAENEALAGMLDDAAAELMMEYREKITGPGWYLISGMQAFYTVSYEDEADADFECSNVIKIPWLVAQFFLVKKVIQRWWTGEDQ